MAEQYLRKSSLVVGAPGGDALEFSDFHFKFFIRKGDIQTPNSIDIRIYNLSTGKDGSTPVGTANKLLSGQSGPGGSSEFTAVSLQAGYEGSFGLIFAGNIVQVRIGRESQADTYVDIRAADGDEAYNFAVINKTLAAGSKTVAAIDAIADSMKLQKGFISTLPDTSLPRGKVMYGMARDHMRDVAQTLGANWSIQDGKLQVVSLTGVATGEVTVINSGSGMIGWPEQTPNGIRVRTLLNPNIKIGTIIQIDNASILAYQLPLGLSQQVANTLVPRTDWDGYYVVWFTEHHGDTRGQDWYTDIICLAVDSSNIPGFLNQKVPASNVGVLRDG
jgi:hypothetical protein